MSVSLPAHLPVAESCDYNQEPIFEVLKDAFAKSTHVLEIGSGTGQHSVYFAPRMPNLIWQTSEVDVPAVHESIKAWHAFRPSSNLRAPVVVDLSQKDQWPSTSGPIPFDAVFTSNTLHIVAWPLVENLFSLLGKHLLTGGVFAVYGPFNYNGTFTTESNRAFDGWLKKRDPLSGVRDFEAVVELGKRNGLQLLADHEMPENNRTLVFKKL